MGPVAEADAPPVAEDGARARAHAVPAVELEPAAAEGQAARIPRPGVAGPARARLPSADADDALLRRVEGAALRARVAAPVPSRRALGRQRRAPEQPAEAAAVQSPHPAGRPMLALVPVVTPLAGAVASRQAVARLRVHDGTPVRATRSTASSRHPAPSPL